MSFDRTKPVNGTTVDADLLRNNMNDLDDRVAAFGWQAPMLDAHDIAPLTPALTAPARG